MKRFVGHLYLSGLVLAIGCQSTPTEQARIHNQEGVARLARNDYSGARTQFESAIAIESNNLDARYNLATTAHAQGNFDEAEVLYRQVLEREPERIACRHGLCALMLSRGRRDEAAAMVNEWSDKNVNSAAALAEVGWYLRETGDLPAAQARLQRAVELDNHQVRALIELGLLYETYHYPERARSLYQQALIRDPEQTEARARLTALGPSTIPAPGDLRAKNP